MKTCTKCGEKKKDSEFYTNRRRPDGLRSECKPCTQVMTKAYTEREKELKAILKDAPKTYQDPAKTPISRDTWFRILEMRDRLGKLQDDIVKMLVPLCCERDIAISRSRKKSVKTAS